MGRVEGMRYNGMRYLFLVILNLSFFKINFHILTFVKKIINVGFQFYLNMYLMVTLKMLLLKYVKNSFTPRQIYILILTSLSVGKKLTTSKDDVIGHCPCKFEICARLRKRLLQWPKLTKPYGFNYLTRLIFLGCTRKIGQT